MLLLFLHRLVAKYYIRHGRFMLDLLASIPFFYQVGASKSKKSYSIIAISEMCMQQSKIHLPINSPGCHVAECNLEEVITVTQ